MPNSEAQSVTPNDQTIETLFKAIEQAVPRSLSNAQRKSFNDFLPWYYGNVAIQDLQELNSEDLCGMALSHWQLCQKRTPGTAKLRVFNPTIGNEGWQSAHTIVELITEDQPHLVSSLRSVLVASGYAVHLIVHPILNVCRDSEGQCLSIRPYGKHKDQDKKTANTGAEVVESIIHIEIDGMLEPERVAVEKQIRTTLDTLGLIHTDTSSMQSQLFSLAKQFGLGEQGNFLEWMAAREFSLLGLAEMTADTDGHFQQTSHTALGLLNDNNNQTPWSIESLLPADAFSVFSAMRRSVVVCKSDKRAPVINNDFIDVVLLLHRDKKGKVVKLNCIMGLFMSSLQGETPDSIPILRDRIKKIIETSNTTPDSHDGRAMASVLRGFPLDMLLQGSTNGLLDMANGIVALHERKKIRLFQSTDPLGRFCNCLVYIPQETYSRELRLEIESILVSSIDGINTEFHTQFSSGSELARLHFIVQKSPPFNRDIDWSSVEARIRQASITWTDRLQETLRKEHEASHALSMYRRYANAFPAGYKEDYSARIAVADIAFIEGIKDLSAPVMSFYRHIVADSSTINFKLFSGTNPVSLSDVIPIIENMGLRVESEHPFEIKRQQAESVWVHEFTVQQIGESRLDPKNSAAHIQNAFSHIWDQSVENDGFNRLILEAGLNWRQVVVLRAYCKYLLQINIPFSQTYMIDSLVANHQITSLLVELFELRFDPSKEHQFEDVSNAILEALDNVASLDQDRILRAYFNLICATLRTNAYCVNAEGQPLDYLSFKFDSSAITDLPLPRPMAEIFVYSPSFEGIHLRGGKVARGGLRWSDRREDFRTEVLGLMKAQMVKNAVIVPVGSKGGFYVKMPLSDNREDMMQQVIACYQNFLRGLLDVTDNIITDEVVPPKLVVRYDEDDPYLVVAADKGTATFSDFANAVSLEYGFWLGDAFASGGSVGYDHKKMGITARGAWVSVQRHFRELGHNCQTEPFTVAGVGDMAGDVFGNGMLLSEQIKLVAAFNHQHIFIDPTPDPASSFAERKRLFNLPRSSWADYNTSLLSKGGKLYSRQDKKITLSAEAKTALGTERDTLTPTELINVILRAPVDLLWNGGIGTYVKASSEPHSAAADRANDGLRVNGSDLRCRVFGEGGNLGCTQRGRIEFARAGGMIYTDAIDNSAGVDCSDHEVNIKILLNSVVANDDMTLKQRDKLLAEMTNDVGELVLRDNYLQTQCINQYFEGGSHNLDEAQRFMQHLESIGRLNREIEFLPNNEEIADRIASNEGLTRSEIAVLVSYSKMVMYDELLASDLAEDPALQRVLNGYFPTLLSSRFSEKLASHRLRSEIIATVITNELVNRLGPTFAYRMQHELGANSRDLACAFVAVSTIFDLPDVWQDIESLDNQVAASIQNQMQILVRGLAERSTHWLLRSRRGTQSIDELINHFEPGIAELIQCTPECLAPLNKVTLDQRVQFFVKASVPESTALKVSQVVPLSSSLDIVEIASSVQAPVTHAAKVYFALGSHLDLQWLREQIGELQVRSHWHTLSKSELRSDLHYQQRHLAAEVLISSTQELSAADMVKRWSQKNQTAVAKYTHLIQEMKASSAVDFAMLSLAVNEVHKLLRSDRPLAAT